MIYRVCKLKETKAKVEVVKVADVVADRFAPLNPSSDLFGCDGFAFYVNEYHFFGDKEVLVAFYPGTDWIIEQA